MMANVNNPNLKHSKSLNQARLRAGIPQNIFFIACFTVAGVFILFGIFSAVIMALVVFPPLISIHKDDDKALSMLLDKLMRPNFYSAGGESKKTSKVVRVTGSNVRVLTPSETQPKNH